MAAPGPTYRFPALIVALALLVLTSGGLGVLLTTPPSPLATADRWFESVAFRFFAPARPPDERIVIVGITDDTLHELAYQSPVDRRFLAGLVRTLAGQHPRAIALDMLFDRPTEPVKDEELQHAIDGAGVPVVIASASAHVPLSPAGRAYLTHFLSSRRSGNADLARDSFDDMVHDYVPRNAAGQPALAAAIAQAAGARTPDQPFHIIWRRTARAAAPFPVYPAELAPLLPADWLRGKIILVGSLIPGLDEHRTPVSVLSRPSYGIEVHAQALSQMLQGDRQGAVQPRLQIGAVGLAACAGIGLAAALTDAALVVGLVGLALSIWIGFIALFAAGGSILLPLAPTLSLCLGAGGASFWRGRQRRQDHQTLRHIFSRYVSEPVLKELWRDRSVYLAGGRPRPSKLTATVLFSDIAGFTPICERLEPEPLIDWLDRYIDVMTQTVTAHGGVVISFMGDGILAVFGAPMPRASEADIDLDAQNAARCALAMVGAMQRINEEWRANALPAATIRLGLQTGPLIAGSLGSGSHIEYCLLGDTVNTAARIEALGKQYVGPGQSIILIGAATQERLRGGFITQAVSEVSLRGKERLVKVYQMISMIAAEAASDPLSATPPAPGLRPRERQLLQRFRIAKRDDARGQGDEPIAPPLS